MGSLCVIGLSANSLRDLSPSFSLLRQLQVYFFFFSSFFLDLLVSSFLLIHLVCGVDGGWHDTEQVITLLYNCFDVFPDVLCDMPSLQEVFERECHLFLIFFSLLSSSNCIVFWGNKVHIGWNYLATLPSSLASLSTLKILDVKVCGKEKRGERGEEEKR